MTNIKQDKWSLITLTSIIIFNCFFMTILFYYNNIIIIVNRFFKKTTEEYYFWWFNRPITNNNESALMELTYIIKIVFLLIFLLEFFYLISNNEYINLIKKRNIIIYLAIGFGIYCVSFLFIKYKAEHYRLFMTLISTEIFSLILLKLVLKVKTEINKL
ncbi:hypothetical protein K144316041_p10080 (plasmid) [Clostridium tetani]|uniref:hypothetical protein n=1 Tax=Clostridium tetani TaxID=1513 RepID=UPI0029543EE6|nr:hypothetical protein [Clostridium tetani]BDR74080.1 hypothetical protein K144316041_p10080 [Clostridium tetani]